MAAPDLTRISELTKNDLCVLTDAQFKFVVSRLIELQAVDRKENQLVYYKAVSEKAKQFHYMEERVIGLGGGNGSSKTDTCLADIAMCATGITPLSLLDIPAAKFRGPISIRVICQSLTTVLHPIILPKLMWWKWNGIDEPGGDRGHWGWIPKTSLIDGSWDRSWSEKYRILRILYRDPMDWNKVLGESSIQFMSHDQDSEDFASGDFHIILHDEPPKYATWRESQARTMRVKGRLLLAMTWPDDPSMPVDWIFDEIYDKAIEGPNKHPEYAWINLFTTENLNLDQGAVASQSNTWSDETRRVRIYGESIRFSNRIHPLFSDIHRWWCFQCQREILPQEGRCTSCGGDDIDPFNHVTPFEPSREWPTIFALDPHPRKPHMFCWVQIDPADDLWYIAEGECADSPEVVAKMVEQLESFYGLYVPLRLIDPNMGRSPSGIRRDVTWQDEFDEVGLRCDLADDSDIGRSRLNEFLKVDGHTHRPRIAFRQGFSPAATFQLKRYVWDDFKASLEKDKKQTPKAKNDDFPTMLKYIMNYNPTFSGLKFTNQVLRTRYGRR